MRVLVVGHERSATTWVGQVLASTTDASYVHEPDDAGKFPYAVRAMAGRGMLPVLASDDPGSSSLVRLWDVAFGDARPRPVRGQVRVSRRLMAGASEESLDRMQSDEPRLTPRLRLAAALAVPRQGRAAAPRRVVKSVHAPLMLDWITARWAPAVVVCFRHPLDVVASVIEAGTCGRTGGAITRLLSPAALAIGTERYAVPLPDGDGRVPYTAWRVGLVMSALTDACRARPEYHVVHHEQLCEQPVDRFREVVHAVGLEWTADTERFVTASNQPGTLWQTNRIAREQRDRWRTRLTPADARAAIEVLRRFPIAARYELDLDGLDSR